MAAFVYIDGLNLYYGALRRTPYRWLNVYELSNLMLPRDHIGHVQYFTTRVPDAEKAAKQETYLRALRTVPRVSVDVIRAGVDVALASQLMLDAARDRFDVALVLTNDAEFARPIRLVWTEFRKPCGVASPFKHISAPLREAAAFLKYVRKGALEYSPLPEQLTDERGTITKPDGW